MAHYANQKTITIHREDVLHSSKQYLAINCQDLASAARDLNSVAFRLYLYLASNKNNYEKDYSPQDFSSLYGVSIDAARKAPAQLVEAGYLVENEKSKYDFYEKPHKAKAKIAVEVEHRLVPQSDGTQKPMSYAEVYEELHGSIDDETIRRYWNSWSLSESTQN